MIHVLIADDDQTNLQLIRILCRQREDVQLHFASNGQEALERVQSGLIDVLITDLRMPVISGDELMETVKRDHPHIPVVIMTGYGSIEGAVDYLHRGADDYLTKPLTKEVFLHRLDRVMERVTLTKELQRLRGMESSPLDLLIGKSPGMTEIKRQLPTLAQTDASIVVYGESGTGKEVVARVLHGLSKRAVRPFVTVNCGALPESLLESELFGYKQGAFTDAREDTKGLVGSADTGTLFLDEIGEVSLSVQVKLLRFLELKEYKPVGDPNSRIADVRIIAATNRDLKQAVAEKTFREDLFYRLNVVPLTLPPLKERPGDVPILATHFLERFAERANKKLSFSAAAYRVLENYTWPGNIRELENKIEHIVVMTPEGEIGPEALYLPQAEPTPGGGPLLGAARLTFRKEKEQLVRRFEREYVQSVLRESEGHITQAAQRAGLDRKNLWQLMKRHDIQADDFKS